MLRYNTKNFYPQYEAIFYNGSLIYGHECKDFDWEFTEEENYNPDDYTEGGLPDNNEENHTIKYKYLIYNKLTEKATAPNGIAKIKFWIMREAYDESGHKLEEKYIVDEIFTHEFINSSGATYTEQYNFTDPETKQEFTGDLVFIQEEADITYTYEFGNIIALIKAPATGGESTIQYTVKRYAHLANEIINEDTLYREIFYSFDENPEELERTQIISEEFTGRELTFIQEAKEHEAIITEQYRLGDLLIRNDAPYLGGPSYQLYKVVKETYSDGTLISTDENYDTVSFSHIFEEENTGENKIEFIMTVDYKGTELETILYQDFNKKEENPDTPTDPENPDDPDDPDDPEEPENIISSNNITDFSTDIDDYKYFTIITDIRDNNDYKVLGPDPKLIDDVLIGNQSIKHLNRSNALFSVNNSDIKEIIGNDRYFAVTIKFKDEEINIPYISASIVIIPRPVTNTIILDDGYNYVYHITDVYTYINSPLIPLTALSNNAKIHFKE